MAMSYRGSMPLSQREIKADRFLLEAEGRALNLVIGDDLCDDDGFRFVVWLKEQGHRASLGASSSVDGVPATASPLSRAVLEKLWRKYYYSHDPGAIPFA